MQIKHRIIIVSILVALFIFFQSLNVYCAIDSTGANEPVISDNMDGKWTATWELNNPDNYTLSDTELLDGKATLESNKISFVEDTLIEFQNGTWENLKAIGMNEIGLDLRRDSYTLISDSNNNRVVEIDYDKWVWQYGSNSSSGDGINELDEPRFAIRIHGNRTLITDTKNDRVIEVGKNLEFYWQYGSNSSSGYGDNLLNEPSSALSMASGNLLIADTNNHYVIEARRNKTRAWQFGYKDIKNPIDSELNSPSYAEELPGGNILIADRGNHRVVEVDRGSDTIIWEYGDKGNPGSTNGKLDTPMFATRLGSSGNGGNTLISDTNNHRVIEVDNFGNIVWQYGKTKIFGWEQNRLKFPTSAVMLAKGNVLITDAGNHRVIEANRTKKVDWQYGTNGSSGSGLNHLDYPCSASRIPKQVLIGYFNSQVLDGGDVTNWKTIQWEESLPQGTNIVFTSRTGNSPSTTFGQWSDWSPVYRDAGGENISSPNNRYIQYGAVLITFNLGKTPVISSVTIKGTRYDNFGELITEYLEPSGLLKWDSFSWNGQLNGQDLDAFYKHNPTSPWHKIPANGDMSNVPIESGMIKIKFQFSTSNLSRTPLVEDFSLIYEALGELDSIDIRPDSTEVMAGDKFEFEAIGFDAYERKLIIYPTWSSTIGVMVNATLHAQTSVGSGFVNATENEISGSAIVNIIPGPLNYIIVKPEEIVVIAGESRVFHAFGYDEFGNEIDITPDWKTDVGVMNDNLFVAQRFAGRGTVKAMVGDIAGQANINVELNSSTHHPPKFLGRVPDQLRSEDSEPWMLNLLPFEWDDEDSNEKLLWYITDVDDSLLKVTGSYSKEDVLTFILEPNAYGNDLATLWLVDSDNMTASQSIWINITPVNDKPVISGVPDISVHYDDPYTFDYSNYIFDLETLDVNLILSVIEPTEQKYTIVNGLNVTYEYPKSMFGQTITPTLKVSDSNSFAEDILQVSITDNYAPILIKEFPVISMSEGESKNNVFDLDDHFMDPDNDPLTYFFTTQYLAVNVFDNHSVSISATGIFSGSEIITFRAMDTHGAMAEGYSKIIVFGVNNPPEILPIPDIYVHYDYKYEFNISQYITDSDNDTNELRIWTDDPEHINFDSPENTLMILNYPETYLGQSIWIILNVSDGIEMVWTTFQVHVTDNYPPIKKMNLPDVYFHEDTVLIDTFNLLDYFTDMDGEHLDFSYNLQDEYNITILINSDNSVDFSSKQDWFGGSSITFRAEDHTHAFIESGIDIIVIPENDPPLISPIPKQNGNVGERWVLDITPYLSDVDNNITELEIIINNEMVTVTGKQLTFNVSKSMDTQIEFIVSDGYSNSTGIIDLTISGRDQSQSEDSMQMVWLLLIIIILIILGIILAVFRKQRGNFIITDAFIIHKNGILIKYIGNTLKKNQDEDIVSGMLTAVQSFISDSFAGSDKDRKDDWKLNQLKMGKHEIMIERGNDIFLTVIYKGHPGKRLPKILSLIITKIENKYGIILDNWNGSYSYLKGIEDIIEPFITFEKSEEKTQEQLPAKSSEKPSKVISDQSVQYKTQKLPESETRKPASEINQLSSQQVGSQTSHQLPSSKSNEHLTQASSQLPPHQTQLNQPNHQKTQQILNKMPKNMNDQPPQQYYPQTPSHINSQQPLQFKRNLNNNK